jgi:hypothetical protein
MKTLFRLLPGLMSVAPIIAADISSNGTWYEMISAADLVAGAGSNLRAPIDSAGGTTVLSVAAAGAWQVKARCDSGAMPAGTTIWVRRVSNGTGSGTISGGEAFVQLSATDSDFFSGSDTRSSISIQFRITGLNCSAAPGSYSSPITFSVQ